MKPDVVNRSVLQGLTPKKSGTTTMHRMNEGAAKKVPQSRTEGSFPRCHVLLKATRWKIEMMGPRC